MLYFAPKKGHLEAIIPVLGKLTHKWVNFLRMSWASECHFLGKVWHFCDHKFLFNT
jgi:hypothetical protein